MRTASVASNLLTGVAAGLGAAFVMNIFQQALARALDEEQSPDTAAVLAADAMSECVSGAPVKRQYKRNADAVLHYLTGAMTGAAYSLIGRALPLLTAKRGLIYGALLWAVADEALVPALGLASPLDKTDIREKTGGLSSHLVFGLALDCFRRWLLARSRGKLSRRGGAGVNRHEQKEE